MLYKVRLLRPNGIFEGLTEDYPHHEILKELVNELKCEGVLESLCLSGESQIFIIKAESEKDLSKIMNRLSACYISRLEQKGIKRVPELSYEVLDAAKN